MMFSWSTNEGMKYTKFQFQLCGVHELFPRKHFWAIHISRLGFNFARVILLYDYKFLLSVAWWCICTIKNLSKIYIRFSYNYLIVFRLLTNQQLIKKLNNSLNYYLFHRHKLFSFGIYMKRYFLCLFIMQLPRYLCLLPIFIGHWYRQIGIAQKCLRLRLSSNIYRNNIQ